MDDVHYYYHHHCTVFLTTTMGKKLQFREVAWYVFEIFLNGSRSKSNVNFKKNINFSPWCNTTTPHTSYTYSICYFFTFRALWCQSKHDHAIFICSLTTSKDKSSVWFDWKSSPRGYCWTVAHIAGPFHGLDVLFEVIGSVVQILK